MNSQIQIPVPVVVGIVAAILVLGWLRATLKGKVKFFLQTPGNDAPRFGKKTITHAMEVKCSCGAAAEFSDAPGPLPPGVQPLPTGDSFACPKCGRTVDLAEIRKLSGTWMS